MSGEEKLIPGKDRAADLVHLLRLIRYEVLEDPNQAILMLNDLIEKTAKVK